MVGLILASFVCMPIAQSFHSEKENGFIEDTVDSLFMMNNNFILTVCSYLYVIFTGFYTILSVYQMRITSDVVGSILEGIRTLCIWVAQLIIFYRLRWANTHTLVKNERFGVGLS
jgi:hypothetical protein